MGNRLLTSLRGSKVSEPIATAGQAVAQVPVGASTDMYPVLPNVYDAQLQHIPSYPQQYDPYAGYRYQDPAYAPQPNPYHQPHHIQQPYDPYAMRDLKRELLASTATSSPAQAISPKPARAPRKPASSASPKPAPKSTPKPAPKCKDTIFDACADASYTRPSGLVWPNPEWIPSTPYKNKMIYAKVVDVYDGDTFTVIIMYGDVPMKLKVRLQGVDAPELVVKREKNRVYSAQEEELIELEMKAGAHVRDKVKKLIEGKEVIIKLLKCDKYGGRQVGTVYLKPQSYETLTEYLLSKRYGKPYQAQKKEDWKKEELLYIISN